MNGWMIVLGSCLVCGERFAFNPEHVPSMPWPPPHGQKEPVCSRCMNRVNDLRTEQGMTPHYIHPDAYGPEPA